MNFSLFQLYSKVAVQQEKSAESELLDLPEFNQVQCNEIALVVLCIVSPFLDTNIPLRTALDVTLVEVLPTLLYADQQEVIIR